MRPATQCRAAEAGCNNGDLLGLILLAILAFGFLLAISAWLWFRWERGPFGWIMRVLGWRPPGR
jgi:uncharacterized membrane protein YeiB